MGVSYGHLELSGILSQEPLKWNLCFSETINTSKLGLKNQL